MPRVEASRSVRPKPLAIEDGAELQLSWNQRVCRLILGSRAYEVERGVRGGWMELRLECSTKANGIPILMTKTGRRHDAFVTWPSTRRRLSLSPRSLRRLAVSAVTSVDLDGVGGHHLYLQTTSQGSLAFGFDTAEAAVLWATTLVALIDHLAERPKTPPDEAQRRRIAGLA